MGPWAYWLSMKKCRFVRRVQDMFSGVRFSRHRRCEPLPVVVYAHKSLIRRTLGTVDQKLQENKAVNLSLAAPRVNGVLIREKHFRSGSWWGRVLRAGDIYRA